MITLGKNSKMPCMDLSIPALKTCNIGTKLAKQKDSICSTCYACKGLYYFKSVETAQEKRLKTLKSCLKSNKKRNQLIKYFQRRLKNQKYFRIHSSGDIFSYEYFLLLIDIVKSNKHVKFWLPTREKIILHEYLKNNVLPSNLTVRLSETFFDTRTKNSLGLNTSGSHYNEKPKGFECKAPAQNGNCLDCRACWDKRIKHISYKKH